MVLHARLSSRQRASWELVQTVTRGKLYLPATPARPPTPPSPPLYPSHISITLLFSALTDIHSDRQMHGDITGFNQLFQQQKEAKGGERGGNHFSVLILHSHSADLCAQCLTAAFFYFFFLGSFCSCIDVTLIQNSHICRK